MGDVGLLLGKAPNSVIEKFKAIHRDHGNLVTALRTVLSRQRLRTAVYEFQHSGCDIRDWNIMVPQYEDENELTAVLQELESYVAKNGLQDSASGLEDLLCGTLDNAGADSAGNDEEISVELNKDKQDVSHQSVVFLVMDDKCNMPAETERQNATTVSTKCIVCEKNFSSQNELDVHYETEHTMDVILCPICNRKFSTKTSIQDHCRRQHLRHLSFNEDGSLKTSERELTKCLECDYVALKKGRMENHLKEVHGIIQKIVCETCGKEFPNHRAMSHHFSQLHTMLNIACSTCGKICKNRSAFQRHQLMHSRMFKCGRCDKTFFDRRCFTQHEKLHLSNTKFSCPHCDQVFNQKHNLERHIKVKHLREGKLLCTACSFSTFYKGVMDKHINRLHLGIKNDKYKCQICKKTFSRRVIYEEHMDVHEGIYRYSCPACGKKYRNKARCKQHLVRCTSAVASKSTFTANEENVGVTESSGDTHRMKIVEVLEESTDLILDAEVIHRDSSS